MDFFPSKVIWVNVLGSISPVPWEIESATVISFISKSLLPTLFDNFILKLLPDTEMWTICLIELFDNFNLGDSVFNMAVPHVVVNNSSGESSSAKGSSIEFDI